jgi:hypothetical protein
MFCARFKDIDRSANGGADSAFGAVLAERRPANLITLCDGPRMDSLTVTGQIPMTVHMPG